MNPLHSILALAVVLVSACQPNPATPPNLQESPSTAAAPPDDTRAQVSSAEELCAACLETCSEEAAEACFKIGEEKARGTPLDLKGAANALEKACEHQHAVACSALALLVQDGRGAEYDPERGLRLHISSCEKGAGIGCFNAAGMLLSSNGADFDEVRAQEFYDKALVLYAQQCDGGDLQWCMNLGVMYEFGHATRGVPDNEKALELYQRACDGGYQDGCVNLALMTAPKDSARAVEILEVGCTEGNALSCGVLGGLFVKAQHGIEKNPLRAEQLLRRACEMGDRQGCAILGALYGLGEDLKLELEQSKQFQTRACQLGDRNACFVLGLAAIETPETRADALPHFALACQIGLADACGMLGAAYEVGDSVEKDETKSRDYFLRGCRLGDDRACIHLLAMGVTELPLTPRQKEALIQRIERSQAR